ncbi:MAG: TIGR03016 family PEP-CTERM system-associated outer membrane protein [Gammaproteobacteria bacterium]
MAHGTLAGEWEITPRLSLEETYTDNVRLVEDGERGDFITSITPGLSVRGVSSRLVTNVDYNLQQLLYGHVTDFDSTNHQLQGDAFATVLPDWLFFDSSARMSQQNIDNRRLFTNNNRGPGDNRRDVLSYEFSPRVEHTFGSWVSLRALYGYQRVAQSGGGANTNAFVNGGSSDENRWEVTLASGSRFARTPVSLSFSDREVEFDSGRVNELRSYSGQGSYILNRKWRLTASGGYDENTFPTNRGNNSGPYWLIGGTWTPSPRTTLTGNWGERFFGTTYNIDGTHTHRRWTITGSYSESIQTVNQFERELLLVPLLDPFGQPIFDPVTSSEIVVPIEVPSLTDDVFLNKSVSVGLNYRLRRGSLGLRYFRFDQEFQSGNLDELNQGASFSSSWDLSSRLRWSFNLTWRSVAQSGTITGAGQGAGDGDFWTVGPVVSYDLGPHTTARLRYEYTRNGGGGGGLGGGGNGRYVENALSANLVFNL